MRQVSKPQDFEKFYFRYVASGEGCGCAERVIDNHELSRLSGPSLKPFRTRTGLLARLWTRLTGRA